MGGDCAFVCNTVQTGTLLGQQLLQQEYLQQYNAGTLTQSRTQSTTANLTLVQLCIPVSEKLSKLCRTNADAGSSGSSKNSKKRITGGSSSGVAAGSAGSGGNSSNTEILDATGALSIYCQARSKV